MTHSTRNQGALICGGAALAGLLFLIGVLSGSYLALAIPVAILVFFALGLAFWVGWTILTVQVEPEAEVAPPAAQTAPPTTSSSGR
ncbi:MAG: hypothetical protein DCC71_08195 [Proteobacteria bacterium]|nr:MAG: hypothetical protein DCC71_08195 [Pseudomonadota bacterium]